MTTYTMSPLLAKADVSIEWLRVFGTFDAEALAEGVVKPLWSYVWAWPVTTVITFLAGYLPAQGKFQPVTS